MQQAAAHFVGEHDFRNFCKADAEHVNHFVRHILDFRVEEMAGCSFGRFRILRLHMGICIPVAPGAAFQPSMHTRSLRTSSVLESVQNAMESEGVVLWRLTRHAESCSNMCYVISYPVALKLPPFVTTVQP